ncbi:hypothetical protein So717_25730 [Roseobacter cerasinus]|uniref:VPLPA-CTERM protein sorting domain-containing protein n=1 Tax=Roseobacter cerasinus TaxID=2602289 RepID=A0A640VTS3_9RHOB|nr:VPLPA-CTERM sorting domain-containing protein [Roseobacter cerasinus]GFE50820.1 hypothetical protein So717_25730 [Roseobacter cerasinus]
MHFFKQLIAAAAISLGGMASAATITDNDPTLTLGAQIDSFAGAQFVPIGPSIIVPPQLPLPPKTLLLAGTPFSLFYADPASNTEIAGTQITMAEGPGFLEVLFDVVDPDTVVPTGELVLAEFIFDAPTGTLPPIIGTLTLFEVDREAVDVIPLPAGLPLLLTGLAGIALLRRRNRA